MPWGNLCWHGEETMIQSWKQLKCLIHLALEHCGFKTMTCEFHQIHLVSAIDLFYLLLESLFLFMLKKIDYADGLSWHLILLNIWNIHIFVKFRRKTTVNAVLLFQYTSYFRSVERTMIFLFFLFLLECTNITFQLSFLMNHQLTMRTYCTL